MHEHLHEPVTQRLPGVGDRLDVTDLHGEVVSVVRLRSGDVAVHRGAAAPIELDRASAASAGAFMAGRYVLAPGLAARLDDVTGNLVFDWVRLGRDDHAVGRTIEQLAIRRRTGVTVVAVLRAGRAIVGVDPDLELAAGDELVFVGRDDDRARFAAYLAEGR